MKKLLLLVAVAACAMACTDRDGATRTLKASGYKDIRITGYEMFSCSKDDFYCTGFVATAPNGEKVSGAVGGGLFFKGSTIRLQ